MTTIDTAVNSGAASDYISPEQRVQADRLLATTNLAPEIKQEELDEMGKWVVDIYKEDLRSRESWENSNKRWLKLANQLVEKKNYPWPNASNVKFPLLSTTALQFHARAFSALIPNENVVKTRVLGKDPNGQKTSSAARVSKHISYQVLHEMEDWQDDFDRALYALPIIGLFHKKSYYSPIEETNVSEVVLPDDLVINYHASSYKRAIKTHRLYQDANEIQEYINIGHYIDVELNDPKPLTHEGVEDEITGLTPPERASTDAFNDKEYNDTPYLVLEAHTWWDLDGDGYKEPYIITVEEDSKKVLRVVARYQIDGISYKSNGKIAKIEPYEYFTLFGFLPNPESKIYYQGFGQLLGPLNAASNTILNQLIDAGTLATMPGGFLGRGMKIRGGELKFSPGQWKSIPVQGDDIRKNVYPLPYKEPSTVLFQLLGLVIQSGEKLSSVQDLMTGANPGQNQPYSTSILVLEQGMKVFSGIYRRIHRALGQEFKKLYLLNRLFIDEEKFFQLMDDPDLQTIGVEDYSYDKMDVIPGSDPNIISEAHKALKANSLLQKKAAGLPINTMKLTKIVLEAEGHDDIDELMQPDPPMEDPKITMERERIQSSERIEMSKLELEYLIQEHAAFKDYAQAIKNLTAAQAQVEQVDRENLRFFADQLTKDYQAYTDRIAAISKMRQEENKAELASKKQEEDSSDSE